MLSSRLQKHSSKILQDTFRNRISEKSGRRRRQALPESLRLFELRMWLFISSEDKMGSDNRIINRIAYHVSSAREFLT